MIKFHVIIPAAGCGARMQSDTPKQYLPLQDKALIAQVVQVFNQCADIQTIHIVLSEQDAYWQTDYLGNSDKAFIHRCGGETRAQSVLNGLHAIEHAVADQDWILVHDAARPGLTQALLAQLIKQLKDDKVGGLLALPLADTVKKSDTDARVATTIPREQLWQAQTPQMFRYATLKQALEQFDGFPTDEAQAIEAIGLQPKLIHGSLSNLKVTYPQDLAVLSALMTTDQENGIVDGE